jgi:hypothetical protein
MSRLSYLNQYTSPYTWFNGCPAGSSLNGWTNNDEPVCKTSDGKLHRMMLEPTEYAYPTLGKRNKKSKKYRKSTLKRMSRRKPCKKCTMKCCCRY